MSADQNAEAYGSVNVERFSFNMRKYKTAKAFLVLGDLPFLFVKKKNNLTFIAKNVRIGKGGDKIEKQ